MPSNAEPAPDAADAGDGHGEGPGEGPASAQGSGGAGEAEDHPRVAVNIVGLDEPQMLRSDLDLYHAAKEAHINLFWGPWARMFNCRGKGLCPLCKVAVLEGADGLPERNKKETKRLATKPDHWRLACQIPVIEGLTIDPFPYVSAEERFPGAVLEEARLRRRALQGDEAAQRVLEERAQAEADAAEAAADAADAADDDAGADGKRGKRAALLGKVKLGPKTVPEAEEELAAAEDALAAHEATPPQTKKEQKPWSKEKTRLETRLAKAKKDLEKAVAKAEKDAEKARARADDADGDGADGADDEAADTGDATDAANATDATGSDAADDADPADEGAKSGRFRVGRRNK